MSGYVVIVTDNNSTLAYPNYKFYFPIRALGKYEHAYLPQLKEYIQLDGEVF